MRVPLLAPTFSSPIHTSTWKNFKEFMKIQNFWFRSATGDIDKQIQCSHRAQLRTRCHMTLDIALKDLNKL